MGVIRRKEEDPDISCRVLVELLGAQQDPRVRKLLLQDLLWKSRSVRPEVKFLSVVEALSTFVPDDISRLLGKALSRMPDRTAAKPRVDIAIVTIKERELRAAKVALGISPTAEEDRNINGLRYWFSRLKAPRREFSVILTMVGEERNVQCAIACQRMFNAFDVGSCFLVGIAAGLKGKVTLGDVVSANLVLDYEHQRLELTGAKKRPDAFRMDPVMDRNLAHFVPYRGGWSNLLKECMRQLESEELPRRLKENWEPGYDRGVVLAGEKLIADGSLPEMQEEYHERVRAGEQEGSGFCRVCDEFSIPWAVFRGVSDYGDPKKAKNWQTLAALAAATAAVTFINTDFRTRDEVEF